MNHNLSTPDPSNKTPDVSSKCSWKKLTFLESFLGVTILGLVLWLSFIHYTLYDLTTTLKEENHDSLSSSSLFNHLQEVQSLAKEIRTSYQKDLLNIQDRLETSEHTITSLEEGFKKIQENSPSTLLSSEKESAPTHSTDPYFVQFEHQQRHQTHILIKTTSLMTVLMKVQNAIQRGQNLKTYFPLLEHLLERYEDAKPFLNTLIELGEQPIPQTINLIELFKSLMTDLRQPVKTEPKTPFPELLKSLVTIRKATESTVLPNFVRLENALRQEDFTTVIRILESSPLTQSSLFNEWRQQIERRWQLEQALDGLQELILKIQNYTQNP